MALRVPHFDEPPVVDGDLNDEFWQAAVLNTQFYKTLHSLRLFPGSHRTELRLGYTDSGLYVGYRVFVDDPKNLQAAYKERDGHVWNDDAVGTTLILDPTRPLYRYSVHVNSIGTIMDASFLGDHNMGWNGVEQATAKVKSDHWVAELELPFRGFGVDGVEKGEIWCAQFGGGRPAISEHNFWNAGFGSNPLDRFGLLIFE